MSSYLLIKLQLGYGLSFHPTPKLLTGLHVFTLDGFCCVMLRIVRGENLCQRKWDSIPSSHLQTQPDLVLANRPNLSATSSPAAVFSHLCAGLLFQTTRESQRGALQRTVNHCPSLSQAFSLPRTFYSLSLCTQIHWKSSLSLKVRENLYDILPGDAPHQCGHSPPQYIDHTLFLW